MKFLVHLTLLFLSIQIAVATPTPEVYYRNLQAGDTLYVAAISGLNMRSTPSMSGTKQTKVPHGEPVILLAYDQAQKVSMQFTEAGGMVVEGIWRKIRYGQWEGYVFGGYLSRLPFADESQSFWEKLSLEKTEQMAFYGGSEHPCKLMHYYQGGISQLENSCGEGGYYSKTLLKEATLAEGYFLLLDLVFEKGIHQVKQVQTAEGLTYQVIMIEPDAGCEGSMRQLPNGDLLIEQFCGC